MTQHRTRRDNDISWALPSWDRGEGIAVPLLGAPAIVLRTMGSGEGISMMGLAGTLVVESDLIGGEVSVQWTRRSRETEMALAKVSIRATRREQPGAMQDGTGL